MLVLYSLRQIIKLEIEKSLERLTSVFLIIFVMLTKVRSNGQYSLKASLTLGPFVLSWRHAEGL